MHANDARIISLMEAIKWLIERSLATPFWLSNSALLIIIYTCKSWLIETIISIWGLQTRPDKFKRDLMSFTVCSTISVLYPLIACSVQLKRSAVVWRRVSLMNDQWFGPSESNSCHKIQVTFTCRPMLIQ